VFGADTVRVTKIEGFRMEAVPEGYILMLHNRDVPGVVGRVGTLLASAASTSPASSSAASGWAAWRSR